MTTLREPELRLPESVKDHLKAKMGVGYSVWWSPFEILPTNRCTTCADEGVLIFTLAKPGSSQFTFVREGKEYHGQLTETFPCVCSDHRKFIDWLLGESGVIPEERHYRIDFCRGVPGREKAFDEAKNILKMAPAPYGGIYLYGPYGTGKSGLLKSLTVQLAMTGCPAHYTTATRAVARVKDTFGDKQVTQAMIYGLFAGYRFLAIDEVALDTTPYELAILQEIINIRHELSLSSACTVLASNLDSTQLPGYVQDRFRDWLRILMSGDSFRGTGRDPIIHEDTMERFQ